MGILLQPILPQLTRKHGDFSLLHAWAGLRLKTVTMALIAGGVSGHRMGVSRRAVDCRAGGVGETVGVLEIAGAHASKVVDMPRCIWRRGCVAAQRMAMAWAILRDRRVRMDMQMKCVWIGFHFIPRLYSFVI